MKNALFLFFSISYGIGFSQTFQAHDVSNQPFNPEGIYYADFDQDGDIDLVTASRLDNAIGWYENLGDRKFSTRRIISVQANQATSVHVGDIDGDGDPDIVSSSRLDNKIAWYSNLGHGLFGNQQIITTQAMYANSVHAEDMDSDGDVDILSASLNDDKIAFYKNLGGGVFSAQQVLSTIQDSPVDVNAADLNGDGLKDIICSAMASNQVGWIANQGSGNFGAFQLITTSSDTYNICPVDLNHDGNIDVLSSSVNGLMIRYNLNLGGGVFSATTTFMGSASTAARGISAYDFDADGDEDIMVGSNQNTWLLQNNGGLSFSAPALIAAVNTYELQNVDLDLDGKMDVIGVGGDGFQVSIFYNEGNLLFQHKVLSEFNYRPVYISYADLDCDGDKDVLTSSRDDNKLAWNENRGNGDFTCQNVISTQVMQPYYISASDLDNDGDLDLLSGSSAMDNVVWLENTGNTQFGPPTIISASTDGVSCVIAADLDNDLLNDVISVSRFDNKTAWYKNLGSGNFGSQQIISTAVGSPTSVIARDIDDDADPDLVVYGWGTGNFISWFENLGNGSFGPRNILSPGWTGVSDYGNIIANDIDADNDIDILSSNKIYKGNSPGQFAQEELLNGPGGNFIGLHDINGDKRADFVGGGSTEIRWWEQLSDGSFVMNGNTISTLQTGQSIAVEDMDDDGDGDILSVELIPNATKLYENHLYEEATAKGQVYVDLNQNDVFDLTDIPAKGVNLNATSNTSATQVRLNGEYSLKINGQQGMYQVTPQLSSNWGITTDSASYHIQVDDLNKIYVGLNFGLYPLSTHDSIQVFVNNSAVACNQDVYSWITVRNCGTTVPSGVIAFEMDPNQSFVSSVPTPDSINGSFVYWNYTNLMYFQDTVIQFITSHTANNGDILTNHVAASVVGGMSTLFNTDYTLESLVNCQQIATMKSAMPSGVGPEGLINDSVDFIDYTIHFKNTSAYAINSVRIIDQLDEGFDVSTVDVIASSHPFNLQQQSNGKLIFHAENVVIPPSIVDDFGSTGFLSFRVWLKDTLQDGFVLNNQAEVHLDCSVLQTNKTKHTLFKCLNTLIPGISNRSLCEGDVLTFSVDSSSLNSTVSWDLQGIVSDTGNEFEWIADSIGTFSLSLQVHNQICTSDSIAMITVNPVSAMTQLPELSFCEGTGVEVFGDMIYTPGLYVDTLMNINGCDSVLQQNVVMIPIQPTNILDTMLTCPNVPVTIFGESVADPMLYLDTLIAVNGCDSIIGIELVNHVVVPPVLTPFATDTVCVYNAPLQLPDANPAGGVYSGNGVNGSQFDPSILSPGTYFVYYTYVDNNGCQASDSTAISVDDCAGIADLDNPFAIKLYPNPYMVSTQILIPYDLVGDYDVLVFDKAGRKVVESLEQSTPVFLLEASKTGAGIFIVVIRQCSNKRIVFTQEVCVN